MKPINNDLLTLITTKQRFLIADLFTIRLIDGTEFYYTNLDIPITYNGNVFVADSLRIDGLKLKLDIGLEVDEQEVRISAYPTDTIGSATFFPAIQAGLLDGGYIIRQRAFWNWTNFIPYLNYQDPPVDVVTLFTGRVSTIVRVGRTHAILKIKSPLVLLDIDMPRNSYQPGCIWNLYDDSISTGIVSNGCSLLASDFAVSGRASAVADDSITVQGGVATQTGADGLPNYAQGTIIFTSGVNSGLRTSISTNDATKLYFRFPPISGNTVGVTFTYYPGCSKKSATCSSKFSNINNFRGYPRVPPIVLSV